MELVKVAVDNGYGLTNDEAKYLLSVVAVTRLDRDRWLNNYDAIYYRYCALRRRVSAVERGLYELASAAGGSKGFLQGVYRATARDIDTAVRGGQ